MFFRQVIGTPMGFNPATFMANLFLYHYGKKYMCNLQKTNMFIARQFSNVFVFTDDLDPMNDNGEVEHSNLVIYPPELELGIENK